jgi:hypothetical protein
MSYKSALWLTTVALAGIFTAYLVIVVFDLMSAYREPAPYFIGDWQINYVAGFVRRGLPGEFARLLFVYFGIDTRTTILVMQVLFYVVFFVASAALLAPLLLRHPLFAFAVFSPMTIAFKALDLGGGTEGSTGSKDVVFLALFAVQAVLSTRTRSDPAASNSRLLVLALAWAAVVLFHEGFFFYLPFSMLLLVLTARTPIAPRKVGLVLVPALLAFVVSGVFHGDPSTGSAICTSLGAGAPTGCERAGAIAWLTRPATFYALSTYYVSVQPPYIVLASAQVAMLGAVGLALLAVDRRISKWTLEALDNRAILFLTICCFVLPLPLFAASDHGRFLHVWFCSALFVLASLAWCRPHDDVASSERTRHAKLGVIFTRTLWLGLAVMYATSWSAQGTCCPDGVGDGFMGRVLLFVAAKL